MCPYLFAIDKAKNKLIHSIKMNIIAPSQGYEYCNCCERYVLFVFINTATGMNKTSGIGSNIHV